MLIRNLHSQHYRSKTWNKHEIDMILNFKCTVFFTLCQKERFVSLLIIPGDVAWYTQNNDRGISLIFAITVVESTIKYECVSHIFKQRARAFFVDTSKDDTVYRVLIAFLRKGGTCILPWLKFAQARYIFIFKCKWKEKIFKADVQ